MKNILIPISIILFILVGLIAGAVLLNNSQSEKNADFDIATTIYPIYDITKNIAPEELNVGFVVPVGASPHDYEPTVDDQLDFTNTELIIAIGGEFDEKFVDLVRNGASTPASELTEIELIEKFEENEYEILEYGKSHDHDEEEKHDDDHESGEEISEEHSDEDSDDEGHSHEGDDPHIWLSPENGKLIAEIIADELKSKYPDFTSEINDNLTNYALQLDELINETEILSEQIADSKIITYHDSYQYLARDLGIEVKGVVEIDAGIEPAASQISELSSEIEEYNIQVIYSEPQLNEENAKIIADDNDLELFVLDPIGGQDEINSYIELIRYNLNIFEQSLT